MKNIYKILSVFIVAGALLSSCENVETGFDKITDNFDPAGQAGLVFLNGNMLKEVENNSVGLVTIPIKLQVWGPLSSAAETVNITVNSAASTAIAGTHYTLATTSVTIPANTGGATFNVVMNTANFDKGETVVLVMTLSNAKFMTNLYASTANLQLSKKPECPFDIKTFVGSYVADERGYMKYNVNFTADATNPNRIWQTNFWDWTDDLLALDLNPVTGVVTVSEQTIVMGDGSGYLVVGSGTFDPCTGIMIVDFQGDVDGTHEVYTPGSVAKSSKGGK